MTDTNLTWALRTRSNCHFHTKRINNEWDEGQTDVQKVSVSLRRVVSSRPTVSPLDTQIHIMACAIHLGLTYQMYYSYEHDTSDAIGSLHKNGQLGLFDGVSRFTQVYYRGSVSDFLIG